MGLGLGRERVKFYATRPRSQATRQPSSICVLLKFQPMITSLSDSEIRR